MYDARMRKTPLSIGEYYHVYNRGVDKRIIFTSAADHERFITLLYACNGTRGFDLDEQGKTINKLLENNFDRGEPLVSVCSYVLMPNHFHLYLKEIQEKGISRFMHKLGIAYTAYFNKKYKRTGSLFQGAFRAEHASRDPYASYIASYIHLNPIKLIEPNWKETGIKNRVQAEAFLDNYEYSSYPDYRGKDRVEGRVLSKQDLPSFCVTAGDFKKEILSWLVSGDSVSR